MLSRAFHDRRKMGPTKSPRGAEDGGSVGSNNSRSRSYQQDDDEEPFGYMTDLPLTFCGGPRFRPLGLREVLQSSVQVLGESGLGISEKIVLSDGVFAAKRFRRVSVSKSEFRRRVERLAHVSARCEYLVPLRAYVYAKRVKVVLCRYYAMGSLADLLTGARDLGHTPLDWHKRLVIILHVARAISFIHSQSPPQEKHLQMNAHGNIKASNVFVQIDFSACLSDYGFVQLAERPESVVVRPKMPEITDFAGKSSQRCELTQKSDIYHFGIMVLDLLGGPTAPFQINCILERKEEIKAGKISFFEFIVEGTAKKRALKVLDMALSCTNRSPDARPTIDQILGVLREVWTV
ncbi:probable inactive receptor kinase At5g58300 [Magnolia sinica]|uniref:probable inactive receptor kinase At5g58300 n=1 Tax=Magnolia sinica TaxID=86752 RepID=UPI00265AF873|nr:probable inactive receptor kinase At5g58300 [Magnolia sinica]